MPKAIYEIDGSRCSTLESFYDEVARVLVSPGVFWGRNLNAFNDILRGGFGTPEGGFILRWMNSELSRQYFGYPETVRQLEAYFAGKLESFDLRLAPEGTSFQLAVWKRLCEIPYGKTISYGELAGRIGNPNASRAVGLANGSNPIPIVIPCHRVIGSNGKLTGYGGGLPIKEKLLALERRQLRLL